MSKEDFKRFVKNKPYLVDYINSGEKTWQDFYELYDIYGENSEIWDKYKNKEVIKSNTVADTSLKELFNIIKKIDLDSVRKGAEGLQKAISLFQGLSKPTNNTYQARPLYQHFED